MSISPRHKSTSSHSSPQRSSMETYHTPMEINRTLESSQGGDPGQLRVSTQAQNPPPASHSPTSGAKERARTDTLKMIGIVQNMRQGRLPHNTEIDSFLERLINSPSIHSRQHLMSPDGKRLLRDFQELVTTIRKAVAVKNKNELFQSFVYHLHAMDNPVTKDQLSINRPNGTENQTFKNEAKQGANATIRIAKLVLLNGEFRDVLNELIAIVQEVFGDAANKASESLQQAGNNLNSQAQHLGDRAQEMADPDRQNRVINKAMTNLDNHLEPNTRYDQNEYSRNNDYSDNNNNRNFGQNNRDYDQNNQRYLTKENEPSVGRHSHHNTIDGNGANGALNQDYPRHENSISKNVAAAVLGEGNHHNHNNHNLDHDHDHSLTHNHHHDGLHQNLSPRYDDNDSIYGNSNNINSGTRNFDNDSERAIYNGKQYKNNLKQQTSQKGRQYQQQALEQARLHHERSKQYARDKFPPEKVDDIIRRLKVVLAEVQRNPDYQYAINTILRLFSTWSHRAMDMSQETAKTTAGTGQTFRSDKNWSQAEQEIKTIIEAWAQGKSLDHLVHSVRDIISDIKNDPALRKYYDEVIFYIHRLLKEPAYVVEDRSTEDGRALIETGRNFTQHRYRNHTNALMDEIRSYTRAMAKDPISMELHLRTKAIHQDLWFDEQGNPAFKPQLINDMRLTLLPALFEQIKYVPIPRIEYSDKQFDVVVENVILAGDTLLPNFFDVKLESYSKFSPSEDTKDTGRQSVFIKMSEIQAVIEDVVFSYNKKSGFPKLSDRGIAALEIGGKGIDVSLKLTSTNDPKHMYKVNSCRCRIDNLKVTVKDSNHDLMYKAMHPMVIGIVRKQIARAIENKIIELLELGDQKLTASIWRVHNEIEAKNAELARETARRNGVAPKPIARTTTRPGLFATLVASVNKNIKTRSYERSNRKREKKLARVSLSSDSSSESSLGEIDGTHHAHRSHSYMHPSIHPDSKSSHFDHGLHDTNAHTGINNHEHGLGKHHNHIGPDEYRNSNKDIGRGYDSNNDSYPRGYNDNGRYNNDDTYNTRGLNDNDRRHNHDHHSRGIDNVLDSARGYNGNGHYNNDDDRFYNDGRQSRGIDRKFGSSRGLNDNRGYNDDIRHTNSLNDHNRGYNNGRQSHGFDRALDSIRGRDDNDRRYNNDNRDYDNGRNFGNDNRGYNNSNNGRGYNDDRGYNSDNGRGFNDTRGFNNTRGYNGDNRNSNGLGNVIDSFRDHNDNRGYNNDNGRGLTGNHGFNNNSRGYNDDSRGYNDGNRGYNSDNGRGLTGNHGFNNNNNREYNDENHNSHGLGNVIDSVRGRNDNREYNTDNGRGYQGNDFRGQRGVSGSAPNSGVIV
ncbi:hypothetical protein J3Q64DRAFT_1850228 [Phycomyces blakesleeanus]|uniref:Uncharacterized protein n=1 Tax=Phycomyces blakesleeanus TaxID=4837 RepID=A0ABR3AWA4_PHYBL